MDCDSADIWFGPGALKGVFGAGVAHGLHESIVSRDLDASKLRLYGSSIGCLTAVFLATGNATSGLGIFREEADKLVSPVNLLPAVGARFVNRVAVAAGRTQSVVAVPSVLNLEHVFNVMAQRTPRIVDQLRSSPIPVFAETVDRRGVFRFVELKTAEDPLGEIRHSLNYFPFTGETDLTVMDSVVKGYGFIELIHRGRRPLVIVLNRKPTTRSSVTVRDLACAAICGDTRVARLFLRRQSNQHSACQSAFQAGRRTLVVSPPRPIRLSAASDYEIAHELGRKAARQVIDFLNKGAQL
jgi:hypothetical protein